MSRTSETSESIDRMEVSRFWGLISAVADQPDQATMIAKLLGSVFGG